MRLKWFAPNQVRTSINGSRPSIISTPVDPRLAKMLLSAVSQGALHEVMIIVAVLSIQDPRERPQEKQQASDEKHRRFADKNQISWRS